MLSSLLTKFQNFRDLILILSLSSTSFLDIVSACLIFLTLPLTTVTAEQSFSKLKLRKTHLRSNVLQHRLNSLATILTERTMVSQLNMERITDKFANKKIRK